MSSPLGGMTINERLAELGLFDEWDDAARRRDRQAMVDILLRCAMSQAYAEMSVDAFLANPEKYGF